MGTWMTLNNHVLPPAGVFIGVCVTVEVGVEVNLHANQVVAVTGLAGGADLPSKLLEIVRAEH